jgi:hypothetical protein
MKVALYLGTKKIPHLGYIKTENLNYEIYSIVLIDFINRRREMRDEREYSKKINAYWVNAKSKKRITQPYSRIKLIEGGHVR